VISKIVQMSNSKISRYEQNLNSEHLETKAELLDINKRLDDLTTRFRAQSPSVLTHSLVERLQSEMKSFRHDTAATRDMINMVEVKAQTIDILFQVLCDELKTVKKPEAIAQEYIATNHQMNSWDKNSQQVSKLCHVSC